MINDLSQSASKMLKICVGARFVLAHAYYITSAVNFVTWYKPYSREKEISTATSAAASAITFD